MSQASTIEWTDATWNPVRGCDKVSPGCKHCYAETFAERWRGVKGHPYELGFNLRLVPEKLAEPLTWKKPRRVFVNSMSDLFHEDVPDAYIAAVFTVMSAVPRHTFQVLTKRSRRMRDWCELLTLPGGHDLRQGAAGLLADNGVTRGSVYLPALPLPNVWLGVSVESQKYAQERIPDLLETPAAVRFVSAEPLLEAVDLRPWLGAAECPHENGYRDYETNVWECKACDEANTLDWVIVGGESGHGARPFNPQWARSIIEQCREAGVAPFVKQLGSHVVTPLDDPEDEPALRVYLSGKGGEPSEWPADLRVREFPA